LPACPPAWLLQELVQRCGLNPKYEEVAREQGGAARVHVKVRPPASRRSRCQALLARPCPACPNATLPAVWSAEKI
jgi:hypothetical protein